MDIARFVGGILLVLFGVFLMLFGAYWGFLLLIPGGFLLWWSFQIPVVPGTGGKTVPMVGGISGAVKNLKKEGNLHSFWLELSGQSGKAVFVEAYLKDVALNEGDSVWVRGKVVEGETLRTSEVKNLASANLPVSPEPPKPVPKPPEPVHEASVSVGERSLKTTGMILVGFLWLLLSAFIAIVFGGFSYLVLVGEHMLEDQEAFFTGIIISVIVFVILQVLKVMRGKLNPPVSKIRLDNVPPPISSKFQEPIFDQKRGFLEGPVSAVYPETINRGNVNVPKMFHVLHFRVEFRDPDTNSVTRIVPVEVSCEERSWVGEIMDGDRVRVEGKYEADGILHAQQAINLRTYSLIGRK